MLKEMDHLQYSFRMRRWLRWRSRACDLQRFTISRYEKSFRGNMFDRCHQWEVHPWNQVSVLFYLIVADAKKACWVVLRPYFTDPGLNRPRNWLILSSNIVEDLDPAVLVLQPPPMAQVQACNQIGVSAGEPWDQTQWSWDTVDSQRAKLIHSIILHHFLEMFQSCGSHGLAGVFPSTVSPSATKLLFWCWKCWLRGSILDGANGPTVWFQMRHQVPQCVMKVFQEVSWETRYTPRDWPRSLDCMKMGSKFLPAETDFWLTHSIIAIFGNQQSCKGIFGQWEP